MGGALIRLLRLPRRSVTAPLSRDCLRCGRLLPIAGLLRGSRQAVLASTPEPFVCPDCETRQRFRARSTTIWFLLLMLGVGWIGFGPVSDALQGAFPKLSTFDRQDYGLSAPGFLLLAIFYFLPATLLARFVTLHLAELEIVP